MENNKKRLEEVAHDLFEFGGVRYDVAKVARFLKCGRATAIQFLKNIPTMGGECRRKTWYYRDIAEAIVGC